MGGEKRKEKEHMCHMFQKRRQTDGMNTFMWHKSILHQMSLDVRQLFELNINDVRTGLQIPLKLTAFVSHLTQ